MNFSSSCISIFLSLLVLCCSVSAIPLSLFNTVRHSDPYQGLTELASTSMARAHHLKNPQNAPTSTTTSMSSYNGAYSISLTFGTPPQTIPMVMDTGTSFSWLPCTKRYICKHCSATISTFIPKLSSSSKIVGCKNPKCSWIHKSFDVNSSCQDCQQSDANCTQVCPPYIILYGLGSTGGLAMVETISIPNKKVENFLVGCSLFSSNEPAGVAGFGRGISSLPNQLGLKKFSYCLVSQKFDSTPKSSFLSMDSDSDSGRKTDNITYTPLLKNPANAEYYYIGLRKITVGGKKVEISYQQLVPDSDGNCGTIVDSGSMFTYMNTAVFKAVADEFSEQVKEYKRAENVESLTGLRPCFNITGMKDFRIPELKLHFKGGAEMSLPLENYFFVVDDVESSFLCLTVVTDNPALGTDILGGPSVILGNFMMQNFHVEFDLRNQRFGFRQQSCQSAV